MKKKSGRNIWGFDGSFMSFCDKLFDVMILGFLWILCSLPLITVGASCTALYYAIVKCIKNHEGYVSRAFFIPFGRIWFRLRSCGLFLREYPF